MKLNLDFSAYKETTLLKNWWKKVKEHFENVRDVININEEAFSEEVSNREKAVNSETSERKNADLILQRGIDNEASARENADEELGTRITDETSKLNASVSQEKSDRIKACDEIVSDLHGKADTVHRHAKSDIRDFAHTHTAADITGLPAIGELADEAVTEKKLSRDVWEKISNPLKPIPATGYGSAALEVMDVDFYPDFGEIMYIKDNPWGYFDTIIGLDDYTWYALPGSRVNEGETAIIVFKTRPTYEDTQSGEFEVITTNVPIDTELSENSSNLVRNSAVAREVNKKADKSHTHTAADIKNLSDTDIITRAFVKTLPTEGISYDFETEKEGTFPFIDAGHCSESSMADGFLTIRSDERAAQIRKARVIYRFLTPDMISAGSDASIILEFDPRVPADTRWHIALVNLDKRGGDTNQSQYTDYNPGADNYDTAGLGFWHGVTNSSGLYQIDGRNGGYNRGGEVIGDMSDVWIHTCVEMPLNGTWITWTLTNRDTEEQIDTGKYDYSEKFDPDCGILNGIELHTWTATSIDIDNISVRAVDNIDQNRIFTVDSTGTSYIYNGTTPKAITA